MGKALSPPGLHNSADMEALYRGFRQGFASPTMVDLRGRNTKGSCVNLEITEEQRLLQDSVAKLFAAQSTPRDVRAAEPGGFLPRLWKELVALGIPTMARPKRPAAPARTCSMR